MKLFSFRKQKQQEGFAFLVKDMFDLRDGGVVVAGQVTEGIIHQGERAVCIKIGRASCRERVSDNV